MADKTWNLTNLQAEFDLSKRQIAITVGPLVVKGISIGAAKQLVADSWRIERLLSRLLVQPRVMFEQAYFEEIEP